MGKFWSLLFLLVPVLGVGIFVCAMMTDSWPLYNHWLPKDISKNGYVIDGLFMFILVLTGIIFIGTGLALFYFLWKYDAGQNPQPVKFTHGNHTLEVVWSILPAVILLFIAIYQMDAWASAKMRRPMVTGADGVVVPMSPLAEVTGRQFEWRIRYPGKDGVLGTKDDLYTVNHLHVPVDEPVVLRLKSQDVLHGFFLPNLRKKQDLVPGMVQHMWFTAIETGKFDIVCAELCGWGHYKMKGRLIVETRKKFDRYLDQLEAEQNVTQYQRSEGEDEDE